VSELLSESELDAVRTCVSYRVIQQRIGAKTSTYII